MARIEEHIVYRTPIGTIQILKTGMRVSKNGQRRWRNDKYGCKGKRGLSL